MDNCPITGQPCPNDKNITVKQHVNGQFSSLNCCNQCFINQTNIIDKILNQCLLDTINNIVNELFLENKPQEKNEKSCDNCGSTINDVCFTGKFGCHMCYETFKEELKVILPQMHNGETKHIGKTPKSCNLKQLEEKMSVAIKEERYEDAAKIRDQIKKLNEILDRDNAESPEIRIKKDLI